MFRPKRDERGRFDRYVRMNCGDSDAEGIGSDGGEVRGVVLYLPKGTGEILDLLMERLRDAREVGDARAAAGWRVSPPGDGRQVLCVGPRDALFVGRYHGTKDGMLEFYAPGFSTPYRKALMWHELPSITEGVAPSGQD
jgi:hypothetical protein